MERSKGLIKRRSSLNSINQLSILEPEEEEFITLNQLEFKFNQINKNCLKYEETIINLNHEIDSKIKEWDSIITQLQKLDEDAQGLTDQIRSSIETLKSTPSMQITASKTSAKNVHQRIGSLREGFERTSKDIESSLRGLDRLEMIMVEEEGTLAAEAKQSGNIRVIAYVALSLSVVILSWFFRHSLGIV